MALKIEKVCTCYYKIYVLATYRNRILGIQLNICCEGLNKTWYTCKADFPTIYQIITSVNYFVGLIFNSQIKAIIHTTKHIAHNKNILAIRLSNFRLVTECSPSTVGLFTLDRS